MLPVIALGLWLGVMTWALSQIASDGLLVTLDDDLFDFGRAYHRLYSVGHTRGLSVPLLVNRDADLCRSVIILTFYIGFICRMAAP